jgi:hypothetical protein
MKTIFKVLFLSLLVVGVVKPLEKQQKNKKEVAVKITENESDDANAGSAYQLLLVLIPLFLLAAYNQPS